LFSSDIDKPVLVEIYGIRGERELSTTLSGSRKYELSLENKPVGLYFIRVVSEERAETGKVVKL
jgi:hypothetical protein